MAKKRDDPPLICPDSGRPSREAPEAADEVWSLAMKDTERLADQDGRLRPEPVKLSSVLRKLHAKRGGEELQPHHVHSGTLASGSGLDRRTQERLRRGDLPIEGRLDLHCMTQDAAYFAFEQFILRSYQDQKRCVLVITGKGAPVSVPFEEKGVLRRNLQGWVETPALRPFILEKAPAQPRHGGGGAFYILLRRQRPD